MGLYISLFHIEPTAKPVIEGSFFEGSNNLRVNWNLPKSDNVGSGFLVRLYDASKELVHQENVTSMIVQSAYIPNLKFKEDYSLEVMVYHCTSLGPPSDLHTFMINSKGKKSVTCKMNRMALEWGTQYNPSDPLDNKYYITDQGFKICQTFSLVLYDRWPKTIQILSH